MKLLIINLLSKILKTLQIFVSKLKNLWLIKYGNYDLSKI